MSQTQTSGGAGQLGERNLSTLHAVAQSLAIGPMFSTALLLGLISNPVTGRRMELRARRSCSPGSACSRSATSSRSTRAGSPARARSTSTSTHGAHPWVGVLTAGIFFLGTLFLGGGGIYLGVGNLAEGFWNAHISDNGPAWWVWGLIALAIVLALNYVGVRVAVGAMLDLRGGLVRADADPRDRDRRQGRRGRDLVQRVRPGRDGAPRPHRRRRARGRAARDPALRRLRGRGLDRRGVARPAPLDPARGALHDRGRRGLLRRHVVRVLDGLRQGGGRAGRLGGATRQP